MRLVRKLNPEAKIVVGGTAVSIFGKYVVRNCQPNTVVVVGEGESAMLSKGSDYIGRATMDIIEHELARRTDSMLQHRPLNVNPG
jgi:hypothetical protein